MKKPNLHHLMNQIHHLMNHMHHLIHPQWIIFWIFWPDVLGLEFSWDFWIDFPKFCPDFLVFTKKLYYIGEFILFSTIWNRTIPGIVLSEFVLNVQFVQFVSWFFLTIFDSTDHSVSVGDLCFRELDAHSSLAWW